MKSKSICKNIECAIDPLLQQLDVAIKCDLGVSAKGLAVRDLAEFSDSRYRGKDIELLQRIVIGLREALFVSMTFTKETTLAERVENLERDSLHLRRELDRISQPNKSRLNSAGVVAPVWL